MMTESRLVFPSSSGISDSDTPKDGEGVSWLPHYHTDAYRYCKAPQRSIFITYLRWEIGGMQKEVGGCTRHQLTPQDFPERGYRYMVQGCKWL